MDFLSKSSFYFKQLNSNIKAMELANQLIEGTQEVHDEVPSFSLELVRDKTDNIDIKADFFEHQTLINNEIINKMEPKSMELPLEEQELTDKLEERAEAKKQKKNDETFTKIDGFYNCPECSYKTQWNKSNLKVHMNAVHREVKPWKCLDCTKGKRIKT